MKIKINYIFEREFSKYYSKQTFDKYFYHSNFEIFCTDIVNKVNILHKHLSFNFSRKLKSLKIKYIFV